MTITPRGFEAGFHDRKKILSPPIPSKVSSFTALAGLRAMALSSCEKKKIMMMSGSKIVNPACVEILPRAAECLFFWQGRMLRVQVESNLRNAVNSISVGSC